MKRFEGIGKNMMIQDRYFKMYLKDSLKPYNLNSAEGIVLLMMFKSMAETDKATENENPGNTQDQIIKEIHYDKGVMTRTMKDLEDKGFVSRNQHPDDSRSFLFSLTKQGLDFKDTLVSILQKWNDELLKGISSEDLEIVERSLEIMANNSATFYCGKLQKHNK